MKKTGEGGEREDASQGRGEKERKWVCGEEEVDNRWYGIDGKVAGRREGHEKTTM